MDDYVRATWDSEADIEAQHNRIALGGTPLWPYALSAHCLRGGTS
ncbi:hypothetical protein [Parvularcula marina]|nr:hypothetical protein [Parvularcula marina]